MSDLTQILQAIDRGDAGASARLLPLVYEELRHLAAARLAREATGHTLQPTALVHEAYLRLIGGNSPDAWDGKGHFFAAAAEAMRRILVDHARAKHRLKRGGDQQRQPLGDPPAAAASDDEKLIALDDALQRLASEDALAARIVELHHFAGLSYEDIAATLDQTLYQVRQKWSYARAWLRAALVDV